MKIYDQTYEPWEGATEPRWRRAAVIARVGLKAALEGTLPRLLIQACAIVAIVFLGILFIASIQNVPPTFAAGNTVYRRMLGHFFPQGLLVLTVAAVIGSGLVARDLRFRATVLYFSRAVGRSDYLAGKATALLGCLLACTLAPALLLWVGQVMLGVGPSKWGERLEDLGALTAHSLAIAIPTSAVTLALSSLTSRAVVAGTMLFLLGFGSQIVSGLLGRVVGHEWTRLVSWQNLITRVGELSYATRPSPPGLFRSGLGMPEQVMTYGLAQPLLILVAVTMLSIGVVLWRLRGVDTVE